MERTRVGIEGVDPLIGGGIPKGATVLLSGGSGTLKTIFCLQYLYEGAVQFNEPGIMVSIEEGAQNILWNMESFNWNIGALEEEKKIKIFKMAIDPSKDIDAQMTEQLGQIAALIKEMGAKRLIVDSTTALGVWVKDPAQIRQTLYKFTNAVKELKCTTLLTAETRGGRTDFSPFGVEEFVVDAVIALYFSPPHRAIFIRKMRGTNHSKKIHPIEVGSAGLVVHARDEVMWESIK